MAISRHGREIGRLALPDCHHPVDGTPAGWILSPSLPPSFLSHTSGVLRLHSPLSGFLSLSLSLPSRRLALSEGDLPFPSLQEVGSEGAERGRREPDDERKDGRTSADGGQLKSRQRGSQGLPLPGRPHYFAHKHLEFRSKYSGYH